MRQNEIVFGVARHITISISWSVECQVDKFNHLWSLVYSETLQDRICLGKQGAFPVSIIRVLLHFGIDLVPGTATLAGINVINAVSKYQCCLQSKYGNAKYSNMTQKL